MTLLFEQERLWTEQAITKLGYTVATCFLVGEKATEIGAHYHDHGGGILEIAIKCVPGITQQDIEERVRQIISDQHSQRP